MTDDHAHLDAHLRRALTALPLPDQDDTRAALQTVLERSGTGTSGRSPTAGRWGSWPAVVAASVAVAVTVTVATLVGPVPDRRPPEATTPTGDAVIGTWQRRVPATAEDSFAGRWTMILTPEGVLALSGPSGAPPAEGASYSTDDGRVRVDAFVNNACAELPAGAYGWAVAADDLTLSLVDDPCPARAALFAGTWRRVP